MIVRQVKYRANFTTILQNLRNGETGSDMRENFKKLKKTASTGSPKENQNHFS